MKYKKFLLAALIAKISIVYFWGFIGTTLIESITDIGVIIKVLIILLMAFILSKIVINKFDID
jgi:membrane protein DedA with SNARE-associated domain